MKPVKYEACRDVGNDAERVFHQLGRGRTWEEEKKRRELVKGGQLRTLWRQDRGTQHLQRNKHSTLNGMRHIQHGSASVCLFESVCVCQCVFVRVQDKTGNEGSPLFALTARENTLVC